MASQRVNPQAFLVGLIKFVLGVAIALFVISLAGVATARYFLTQLSTLPERPVYDNDAPVADAAEGTAENTAEQKPAAPAQAADATPPETEEAAPDALYEVVVTYGAGLLLRTGAGADSETIGGIDYDETVEVLEESGRWYKVRTSSGTEGWIKGQGNTQKL
ncbi:SH3 domain-containing protein [Leptolyngbya cf. ectocarpi LEGE 11479]|uniref:SH3 domain-containing protein n=1 Tax=Leptolyngbya cf. ectocarpi LEGE 11479 TaxID=1828722 RepID=A0A928ZWU3_LEPEC|nr:SH3 domain-containing protein [Leptolyngbya ectocarpi]MBE9068883.1 SH3 domain-containing protein [Leptolyngbya cf. ectocarpi LEGE 11479]